MNNGFRTYNVELDFEQTAMIESEVSFKQYDYGTCTVMAKLTKGGATITLTDNDIVVAVFKNKKGDIITDNRSKAIKSKAIVKSSDEGIIEVPIPKEILKEKGKVSSELVLIAKDKSYRRTSPAFIFFIIESLIDFDDLLLEE